MANRVRIGLTDGLVAIAEKLNSEQWPPKGVYINPISGVRRELQVGDRVWHVDARHIGRIAVMRGAANSGRGILATVLWDTGTYSILLVSQLRMADPRVDR